ncbi:MAG: Ig-like domain-containing protein [Gemmatimonadota bacterium]
MNRIAEALCLLASAITLTACGGGGGAEPIQPLPTVASVTVSPSDQALAPQQTAQLSAAVKDAQGNALSGHAVDWSSSQPGTSSVSNAGLVTAVAPGSATITATSAGKSAPPR